MAGGAGCRLSTECSPLEGVAVGGWEDRLDLNVISIFMLQHIPEPTVLV